MPNGLNDPEDPTQAGWGGCHAFGISPDMKTYAWNSWQEPQRSITEYYERRFYPDELNEFASRLQWAEQGKGNKNPIVNVNGNTGIQPLKISAIAGQPLKLDASSTTDPDGDKLNFKWWHQAEAGTYHIPLYIETPSASSLSLQIPSSAKGKSLHIVCEVHDEGPFKLVAYKRIIIDVK